VTVSWISWAESRALINSSFAMRFIPRVAMPERSLMDPRPYAFHRRRHLTPVA
jgi:hypothetical protein